jgi:hypothetical protein
VKREALTVPLDQGRDHHRHRHRRRQGADPHGGVLCAAARIVGFIALTKQ